MLGSSASKALLVRAHPVLFPCPHNLCTKGCYLCMGSGWSYPPSGARNTHCGIFRKDFCEDFCSLVSVQRYLTKDETAEEPCRTAGEWGQREVSCVLPGWGAASKASSARDTSHHPELPSPCSWLPFLCSHSGSCCLGVVTAQGGRSWLLLLFSALWHLLSRCRWVLRPWELVQMEQWECKHRGRN